MANWMIQCGNLIQPLINLSRDSLLAGGIIFMDETTVQVLNEPDKNPQSKSYLWVQRGGPPNKLVILFDYDPGRSQTVPQRLLEGYQGALQTDGYAGYNAVVAKNNLIHLGFLAHARRQFTEVIKAQGKNKNKKTGKAQRALNYIQQLYEIEKSVKCVSVDERFKTRQALAIPILTQCRTWLDEVLPLVPPKTTLGKALLYLNNEWPKLIRYVDDGRYCIDNNLAENAIRPFVVGRKNWLFSQSVKGVKASANLYSLIETAKANGLEPYAYLKFVFTHLPRATSLQMIEALLPWNVNSNIIKVN